MSEDATTLLASVEYWSDSRRGPNHHPTLTSNAVMYELTFSLLVSANVPRWRATW
jgi:hypothetical protein